MRETAITTPPRYIHLIEDDGIYIYLSMSFFVCGGFLFSNLFVIFVCLFLTEINFEMGRKRNLRRAFPTAPG